MFTNFLYFTCFKIDLVFITVVVQYMRIVFIMDKNVIQLREFLVIWTTYQHLIWILGM
jgi:hypothetical protein